MSAISTEFLHVYSKYKLHVQSKMELADDEPPTSGPSTKMAQMMAEKQVRVN